MVLVNKKLLLGAGLVGLFLLNKRSADTSNADASPAPTPNLFEQAQATLQRILTNTPTTEPTSTGYGVATVADLAALNAQGLAPTSINDPNYFAVQAALEQAQSGMGITWSAVSASPTGNPYSINTDPLNYTIFALQQVGSRIVPQTTAQLGEYMSSAWTAAANIGEAQRVKNLLREAGYGKESAVWSWAFPS